MKIFIETHVKASYLEVAKGFDLALFEALAPSFPKVQVLRFDGCEKGNQVWIAMNLIFFKQQWNAIIIDNQQSESEWSFMDEGIVLPFPLKSWKHHHRVLKKEDGGSIVIDSIEYRTFSKIVDYLCYPLFYLQFSARSPIYKKIFSK